MKNSLIKVFTGFIIGIGFFKRFGYARSIPLTNTQLAELCIEGAGRIIFNLGSFHCFAQSFLRKFSSKLATFTLYLREQVKA